MRDLAEILCLRSALGSHGLKPLFETVRSALHLLLKLARSPLPAQAQALGPARGSSQAQERAEARA